MGSPWHNFDTSFKLPARPRFIPFGDSITAQGSSGTAPYYVFEARGYWVWAAAYAGGMQFVRNAGVSGNNTTEALARIYSDVLAYESDIVLVHLGTNDPGESIPIATSISNLLAICTAIVNDGRLCVLCTCIPHDNSANGTAASTYPEHIAAINNWIRQTATYIPGVVVADTWSSVVDLSDNSLSSTYQLDITHPNVSGAQRMGLAVANAIAPYINEYDHTVTAGGLLNPFNLVPNGCMYGDNASGANGYTNATGFSGTGPHYSNTSRSGSATAVASTFDDTGFAVKRWRRLVGTFTANNEFVASYFDCDQRTAWAANTGYSIPNMRRPTARNGYAYRCIVAGTSHATTEPTWPTVVGDIITDGTVTWQCVPLMESGVRIAACMRVKLSGATPNANPYLLVDVRNSGGTLGTAYGLRKQSAEAWPLTLPDDLVIWTPEIVLPAGSDLRIILYAGAAASGAGDVTCDITDVGLFVITDSQAGY